MSESNSSTQTLQGTVVSNKMQNTVVVRVDRRIKHPKYGKVVTRSSKFHAHDSENVCNIGDLVTIKMCRPISKTKSWLLVDVVEKAS
jgi:small subunit ribosomal protein S17